MIEVRSGPVDGRVALRAVLRKTRRLVRRVVGAVPIGLMAVEASAAGEIEVVVDVAGVTGGSGVCACQGKSCGRVIESSSAPVDRCMALRAVLGETRGLMRRVVGALPIGLMAVEAGPAGEIEVVVYVAGIAGGGGVRAGQDKTGGRVIEICAAPVDGAMALRAVLRESSRLVRRIVGARPVGPVAGNTSEVR